MVLMRPQTTALADHGPAKAAPRTDAKPYGLSLPQHAQEPAPPINHSFFSDIESRHDNCRLTNIRKGLSHIRLSKRMHGCDWVLGLLYRLW